MEELGAALERAGGDVAGVSKVELIRHNNQMVEKIGELENKANPFKRGGQEGKCGFGSSASSSPSKLKKRIQMLKGENESLMKNLAL